MKAYDEESVASLSTTQDETQDSFQMNNGTPESAYILQGGYMLAASYWPKVNEYCPAGRGCLLSIFLVALMGDNSSHMER